MLRGRAIARLAAPVGRCLTAQTTTALRAPVSLNNACTFHSSSIVFGDVKKEEEKQERPPERAPTVVMNTEVPETDAVNKFTLFGGVVVGLVSMEYFIFDVEFIEWLAHMAGAVTFYTLVGPVITGDAKKDVQAHHDVMSNRMKNLENSLERTAHQLKEIADTSDKRRAELQQLKTETFERGLAVSGRQRLNNVREEYLRRLNLLKNAENAERMRTEQHVKQLIVQSVQSQFAAKQ